MDSNSDINNDRPDGIIKSLNGIPNNQNTISNIIEQIGLGKFQIISYSFFSFGMLLFGSSLFAWSFFTIVLQNQWNLTIYEVDILGSIFFVGFTIGSMISGPLSDKYGRRNPYLFLIFSISLNCCLLGIAPNYIFFIVFWTIQGALIGMLFLLLMIMTIEVSTLEWRGRMTIIVYSLFTFGELYGLLICYLTFSSFESGNWRILFFAIAIPSLVVGVIGIFVLKETPIFALQSDFPKGIEILKWMYKQNKGEDMILTDDDIQQLRESIDEKHRLIFQEDNHDYLKLFSGDFKTITPLLWIIFFTTSLIYSGCIYVYPIVLNDLNYQANQSQNFFSLFISIFSEFPSYILLLFTVDTILGRKMSLFSGMTLAGLAFMLAYWANGIIFILLAALGRTFSNCGLNLVTPFAGELYHTKIRAIGLGIGKAIGGVGNVLMPWILNTALHRQLMLPYLILGGLAVIGGIASFLLPYDTTGRTLDSKYELVDSENDENK